MSARPPLNPVKDRAHARLVLTPILVREGCDVALLEPVLDVLIDVRELDGPACAYWLLG